MKINKNLLILSHRGNLTGSYPELENHPDQIKKVLDLGLHCEIDVFLIKGIFYLGHDYGKYKVKEDFLMDERLYIHCKDLQSLSILKDCHPNVFCHQNDDYTMTSSGQIWTCNKENLNDQCILMWANPRFKEIPKNIYGLCTDYSLYYSKKV